MLIILPQYVGSVTSAGSDQYFNNVVALLHMNGANTSTTFTDVKNHAFKAHGTAQISTARGAFGQSAKVAGFANGIYCDTNVADFNLGSSSFTIEFWMYALSGLGGNASIMGQWVSSGGPTNNGFIIIHNGNGTISFLYSTSGTNLTTITSATAVPINTAANIAIVRDVNTIRLFINGNLDASAAISGTIYPSTQNFEIGGFSNSTIGTWNGHIDELRITKGIARYTSSYTVATLPFPDSR